MSDPVTNVDIEDVLSSIRRLISDDEWARPEVRNGSAAPKIETDSNPAPTSDRFVLTPALRVVEADIADEISNKPVSDDDTLAADHVAVDVEMVEAAEVEAEAEQAPDEAAGDGMTKLERMIAELEAAVTDQPDEWEPDGTEVEDLATDNTARPMEVADDVQDADEIIEPATVDEAEDHAVQDDETDDEFHAETDDALEDDDLDAFIQQNATLDEAVLREMVTDIVRQELQGALGERITRNVRKLVRREIYRVMNSQEFE